MQIIRLILASAALVAVAQPASAERLFGLTVDNRIVTFNSANPTTVLSSRSITGLAAGEQLVGLDERPATGALYTLSTAGSLYQLNRTGGSYSAMFMGTLSTLPSGTDFGFDFNPVPDRLRVVSNNGQNLRINVDGGATIVDGMITSDVGVPMLVAAAYTNSVAGATSTILYALDASSGGLLRSTNPNAGIYTGFNMMGVAYGPLGFGFTLDNNVSFEISGQTGAAFAVVDSLLWQVNLETGAARTLGIVGAGPLIGLTTSGVVPEPATWAMLIAGFGLVGAVARRRRAAVQASLG